MKKWKKLLVWFLKYVYLIFTDIIGTRNIPSTSSHAYIRANKPYGSSTNYVANVESNQILIGLYGLN